MSEYNKQKLQNYQKWRVIKRDGSLVPFAKIRITNAIYRAANAVGGRDHKTAEILAANVISILNKQFDENELPVEAIQDTIEKVLIESGKAQTAKAFIIYRAERKKDRERRDNFGDYSAGESLVPWKKVWESLNWSVNHGVLSIEDLNRRVKDGSFPELIQESEEAYQLEISRASEILLRKKAETKIVIVSGPSSSGKTTTTLKLAENLKNEGLSFVPYHVDNYFFDLHLHPKDENGDFDYETPEAIDLSLLNEDLKKLVDGKEVTPPYFNFKTGKREGSLPPTRLDEGEILLIDSHHGMHPEVTRDIPAEVKVSLYTEPILQLRGPDGSYIKWTDLRLMRRIYRDQHERGKRPLDTVKHWRYVRRSELRYIIPASKSADAIINTALPYGISLWKYLLSNLFNNWVLKGDKLFQGFSSSYERVLRVDNMFKEVASWEDMNMIPKEALIREFIGQSPSPL